MNNNVDEVENNKRNEHTQLFFRGYIDGYLLAVKSLIVLNSGALALVLISTVNSKQIAISEILIESSSCYGFGLTFAVLGLLFFMPIMKEIELHQEIEKKYYSASIVSGILSFISMITFLYGVWFSIVKLKTMMEILQS